MGMAAAVIGAGAIGAVGSLASGAIGANAANSAASAQERANQAAIGEQQREFDIGQRNLAPWLQAGTAALGQERDLLGLGGAPDYTAYVNNNGDLLDAYKAYQQGGGTQSISDWGQNHWNTYGQNEGRSFTPTTGTAQTAQQSAIDALKASPYYQSLFRNGQNAILANASATGGLRGGNIQASLANFGADTLAQTIQQQLNSLGGISGNGLNSGTNINSLGATTAGNISSLLSQNGSAQSGGILAGAGYGMNGINGALSSALRGFGQYSTLSGGVGMPQFTGIQNMGAGTDVAGLF